MSQQNVEIVRRAYELFNGEGFKRGAELDLGLFAADIELDRSDAPMDAAVYRGHDGLRELISLLREMWESQRLEPQELIPIGDDRVVVSTRIVSVGREGIETVARAASIWTVRGGRITHVTTFQSKAEALEAAVARAKDPS